MRFTAKQKKVVAYYVYKLCVKRGIKEISYQDIDLLIDAHDLWAKTLNKDTADYELDTKALAAYSSLKTYTGKLLFRKTNNYVGGVLKGTYRIYEIKEV